MTELAGALVGFGEALVMTIVIEAPVAWLAGLRTRHDQLVLLLINCITNPLLNLLLAFLAALQIHRIAAPFDPPLQDTLVCETGVTVIAGGAVMLNVAMFVQEFASVTVQVDEPAVNPLTEAVPSPVGLPGVQL